jgi:hypothetical protein
VNSPATVRLLPPIPPALRFSIAGIVIGILVYAMASLEPAPVVRPEHELAPSVVVVPELDHRILACAKDGTREQRLVIEVEPLRHLLAKAIDVGPTVARALGATERAVPVAEVRDRLDQMRWRWLWYEGVLEQLSGPRDGHPVPGYSIYEAAVRLADGNRVLAAFSLPPPDGLRPGDWVRVDGYLLKLRDTTYPQAIDSAPMLVGRELRRDYEDWPPVSTLDPAILAKVEDKSLWPGDPIWHSLEEDQTEALWHLAAWARDTASERTAADWRRLPALNAHDMHEKLVEHQVARGTPMRIIGPLIRLTTIPAPPNPAGVEVWSEAWVQVREYGGGAVVPIWVPKRIDIATRAQLEVRGFYYRWLAYETAENERRRIPLFVAADLDLYQLATGPAMRTLGLWLGGAITLLFGFVLWHQRRTARSSDEHSRDLDARRRRRRERQLGRQPHAGDGS